MIKIHPRIPSLRLAVVILGFIITFGVITEQCQAQSLDSLRAAVKQLQVSNNNIQLNLAAHQKQFSTGTFLIIGGVATSIAGFILYDRQSTTPDGDGNDRKYPWFVYVGSVVTSVGVAIQIDSHKYIGRAGRRRK